jgi:hypothetical protein
VEEVVSHSGLAALSMNVRDHGVLYDMKEKGRDFEESNIVLS